MRKLLAAATGAATLLGGCETLNESYLVEREVIIDGDGYQVVADEKENTFDGARFVQFSVINSSDYPICAQVVAEEISSSGGYSLGRVAVAQAGATANLGYVDLPARYSVNADGWDPKDDGTCGYPPPR